MELFPDSAIQYFGNGMIIARFDGLNNQSAIIINQLIRYLLFLAGILFFSTSFSQNSVTDSLSRDSLNKAFLKQVKSNEAAVGVDTSHFVTADETPPLSPREDSLKNDSILRIKKLARHSPKKAAMYSGLLPGLGQAYNKKYWKIPIIYAGFAGLGVAIYYTSTNFYGYRNAYRSQEYALTYGTISTASYNGVFDPGTLKAYRDYFKNDFDISCIITGAWYVLNIVDATVDAHLFEWNMKDDLSVSWHPTIISGSPYTTMPAAGVSISLGF